MFKDIRGLKGILDELSREILVPLRHPYMPRLLELGIKPISGILLHGPPGCGKTMLAHAIANETGIPFYKISAVSGVSGGMNIRAIFSEAYATSPSIVFIDEIDAIGKQIVTQLLTCMNESLHRKKPGYVLVIGATNRPDAIDAALRRRFDREFALGMADENARTEIFSLLLGNVRFVGADLSALSNLAGNLVMRRRIGSRKPNNEETSINMGDFEDAVKMIRPSSRIEGFLVIPNVKWEDVGGLDLLRKEFEMYIVDRIKDSEEELAEFGVDLEQGFLLYGPTCGKTLIAKAIASESGANFVHINGPECLNKRGRVRIIFSRARTCSPCIIFFDHLYALTRKRGEDGMLNRADKRQRVFVIGATDKPEVLGEAIKRRGRLGKHMYVPLPGPRERGMILKAIARNKPISEDVDLIAIGKEEAYENLSGTDLAAVTNEAAMIALEEKRISGEGSFEGKKWMINKTHFDRAVEKIAPSV
ncbi:hypothetical protein MKX03_000063 [Papaver bracteatum]|nr:hypothetical protein MKX03_000063 [Papaver bracteatum]